MGNIISTLYTYIYSPSPTFPYLHDLPLEIRLKIYTLALPTAQYLPLGPGPYYPNLDKDTLLLSVPALCRTTRALRNESLPIFYGQNSFSLALKHGNFFAVAEWLDTCFDDRKASLLRRVVIKEDEFTPLVPLFRSQVMSAPRDSRIAWADVEAVWRDVEACRGRWGSADSGTRRRHLARLMVVVGRDLGFCSARPKGVIGKLCEWGEPGSD